jgi:hypothetical protein
VLEVVERLPGREIEEEAVTTLLSLVRLLRKTLRVLELTHLKPMVAVVVAVLVLVKHQEEMVALEEAQEIIVHNQEEPGTPRLLPLLKEIMVVQTAL